MVFLNNIVFCHVNEKFDCNLNLLKNKTENQEYCLQILWNKSLYQWLAVTSFKIQLHLQYYMFQNVLSHNTKIHKIMLICNHSLLCMQQNIRHSFECNLLQFNFKTLTNIYYFKINNTVFIYFFLWNFIIKP